ncbi:hypothetical protein HQ865_01165 [Mucilaginibacter mali]|uniref:Uncharacterized protein n=1 Tax=Mucilaginibacter mali TaxID=2740462 RepID=A0A7D4Q7V6_9SPHI|nr:hypothetical protein [Mucilaginibacter mali]QKJ28424.1 hypothetical protein HQ865_01165 [Mucilaginibacter mali]
MTKIIRTRILETNRGGNGGGGSGGDSTFNGARPITRNPNELPGLNTGALTVGEFLEAVFFPAVAPTCTIAPDYATREVGGSPNFILTWEAVKHTNAITGINVAGNEIAVLTGESQNGTQLVNLASGTGTFSITATDGTLTGTASCTIKFLPKVFWGTTTKDGSGSPILDTDIRALVGQQLRSDRLIDPLINFGGGSKRLIFAFPTAFGNPAFNINGLVNTAFTKVRSASNFTNAQGATVVMDVWVSDNIYNSPLDTVTIN